MHTVVVRLTAHIKRLMPLSLLTRVRLYNEIVQAAGALVTDLTRDPACTPRLIPVEQIAVNDYNPNHVAAPELDLLEQSMRADGITMPVVVVAEGDGFVVVDGFHRRLVASERLGRTYLPCSVIAAPLGDRMASTIRHNRARGKHQVELMGAIVKSLLAVGWAEDAITAALGMSVEEVLRLRQTVGVASLLAAPEYTRAWKGRDGDSADHSGE